MPSPNDADYIPVTGDTWVEVFEGHIWRAVVREGVEVDLRTLRGDQRVTAGDWKSNHVLYTML